MLEIMSQKGGNIVFMGSVGHKFGGKPGEFSYAASKFCLEYFPRIFRECGKNDILVNTIRLGATEHAELAERSHHNQPNLERKQLTDQKSCLDRRSGGCDFISNFQISGVYSQSSDCMHRR